MPTKQRQTFRPRRCEECKTEYTPTAGRQRWCLGCSEQQRRDYHVEYNRRRFLRQQSKRGNAPVLDCVVHQERGRAPVRLRQDFVLAFPDLKREYERAIATDQRIHVEPTDLGQIYTERRSA